MSFFPTEPEDQQLHDWSQRLYLIRKRLGKPKNHADVKAWDSEFRALRTKVGADVTEKALAWYEANAGKEYVPSLPTANIFRRKFDQLLGAMQRSGTFFPEIRWIKEAERLKNQCTWPPEVAGRLPEIVQRTAENWGKWLEHLYKKSLLDTGSRETRFLQTVLGHYSLNFIDNWMTTIHTKVSWKDHWDGNVLDLVFRPDSEKFKQSFWWDWSECWSCNPNTFDKLLEELLKEYKNG